MVQRTVTEWLIDQVNPSMIGKSDIASPDCRRVAYVARAGKKHYVAVDGQEQRQYDMIENGSLVFSPDSQWVGYVVRGDKKWFVVVDGQRQKKWAFPIPSQTSCPSFSFRECLQ